MLSMACVCLFIIIIYFRELHKLGKGNDVLKEKKEIIISSYSMLIGQVRQK